MAALPDREPDLLDQGGERGAAKGGGKPDAADGLAPALRLSVGTRWRSRAELVLAGLILIALGVLCWHFNRKPRHEALAALPDTLRVIGATIAVFGLGGLGLVRLLLPASLRRYELLWILPSGACAVGLSMTVLGFLAVPYRVSLGLVLVAGAALGAYAVHRRGWPAAPSRRLAWPAYLALIVGTVALVPMLFEMHLATVTGEGSDAHMATGTATFLKHSYPTGVAISQPIDRMPPLWKSKYPIYYAFAAISSISGLDTWQVLAPLIAAMLAMAAVGMYLVAREVLGASPAIAVAAMALAGLDRMALHTGMNPYFNQTWGYFAMPFALVIGWFVVQPGVPRRTRQATAVLLALFGLVLVFAYPLAAPIPIVPIAIFAWTQWRAKLARGEPLFHPRSLYRGRRSLLWLVPLAIVLAVPVYGVAQKAVGAAQVLAPGSSLLGWGGDLRSFIPFDYFLSLPNSMIGTVLVVVVLGLAVWGLARQPPAIAWGIGGLLAVGLLIAIYFRHRHYGFYFHFKLLAFIGPLLLLIAALGAGRLRRLGPALLAVLSITTAAGAYAEVKATGFQLDGNTIALRDWGRALPPGASIRLDISPPQQLWAAYFLASRPLCSQLPLISTDYPHVPISRKADFIVASTAVGEPADAVGPPLRADQFYRLFRENPAVPGMDRCSQRKQDRLFSGADHGPT